MKLLRNLALGTMIAGCAGVLAAAEKPPETSIPFIDMSQSIHGWQPDGREGIWIEDVRKQWYYAKVQGPCIGLDFAVRLGFETKTLNTLDKYGSLIVPNESRCPLTSLVKSDPPPGKNNPAAKAPAAK